MARYATRLGRDPAATYRQIHVVGRTAEADPHALVALLYDELIHALRTLAWATEHRQFRVKSDKATRATAIPSLPTATTRCCCRTGRTKTRCACSTS